MKVIILTEGLKRLTHFLYFQNRCTLDQIISTELKKSIAVLSDKNELLTDVFKCLKI